VHAGLKVGQDALGEQPDRGGAHPVSFGIVRVAVISRRGDYVHARAFGHRAHAGRVAAKTDGCDLDDGLQAGAGHLVDRLVDVVEVLAWKGGAAQKEVVVRVRDAEAWRRHGPQDGHDLTAQPQPAHEPHYKRDMSRYLGLDLGGTNLKWVVVEHGREAGVLKTGRVRTDTHDGEQSVVRQMIGVAAGVVGEFDGITSVGVGMPGVLDLEAGATRFIPNIPGRWNGVQITDQMTSAVKRPTRLINDARAFTLAEHALGAGRGANSMLGITLGTGVGGGLILGGRLYLGYEGTAGEFGHQTILPEGLPCTCGNVGCLETLARADAIAAACGQPSAEQSVAAARAGDARAQKGLAEAGRYLGIGASNVVALLSVDSIVIGGGVAAAGDMLLDPIRQELKRRVHITDVARVTVACGELGIWAGAIGAALHGASFAG
jgi:glucokinase